MIGPIQVQRAAQLAEGRWKLRFGRNGLVVTVEITRCYELNRALDLGSQIAEKQLDDLEHWNEKAQKR